jgi:hypothetical protein
MSNTSRVDKSLFEENHYLGKPADSNDLLVKRRIRILDRFEGFFNNQSTLVEIKFQINLAILTASNMPKCTNKNITNYRQICK